MGSNSAVVTAASTHHFVEGLSFHPERNRNIIFHKRIGLFLPYLNHIFQLL